MKKYTLVKEQNLSDLNAVGKLLIHNKSGARILLIENEDNNKVFSVTFKTTPIDDSGLSHILEHSVLCGSEKYPLKEPFVELIKGSLNTFLNAFTFADKTMYPVASQNDQDFKNLMSVYMDAVFNPLIYNKEEIFLQEGWRYELSSEGVLTYNGVVYNEMKGALSSPDDVLANAISRALYPDNAYRFVSGGDPKSIPNLSYESFLDFHQKLYHPANSYIFLYGNFNEEERLNWLDDAYLSKYEKIEIDTDIEYQKPFSKPIYYQEEYPIPSDDDKTEKYYYSYNVCFNDTLDVKTSLALDMLINNLFNIPGAPVKEAVIKQGLGADMYATYRNDYQQPMINIVLMGAKENDEEKFIEIIDSTLKQIVKYGVDKNAIIAAINFDEFKLREAKYSIPKGIIYNITAFTSWLYDENEPFLYLDVLKYYKEFKGHLNTNYYEKLIEDAFINNNHKAYVSLIPSKTKSEEDRQILEEKLRHIKENMTEEELTILKHKNIKLKLYQESVDNEEVINTLPKLNLNDIERTYPQGNTICKMVNGIPFYVSDYNTNDILYVKYMFDITKMNEEESKNLKLLINLLGYMSTNKYTYGEIFTKQKLLSGGMSILIDTLNLKDGSFKNYLTVKFSALEENVSAINELLENILFNTKFEDKVRLKEILNEYKQYLDMDVINSGNVYAARYAFAQISKEGYFKELTSGVTFKEFINECLNENLDDLIKKLKEINQKVFGKDNLIVHITSNLKDVIEKNNFISCLPEHAKLNNELEFVSKNKNIGLCAPVDINFVALIGKYGIENKNGSLRVIQNAISNSYLWQEVRVKGGAYGAGINFTPNGYFMFTSFRDKNIKETIDAYKHTVEFLENYNPTKDELDKVKIGAIGILDTPLHQELQGQRDLIQILSGITYEEIIENREKLLDTSLDDFKALAQILKEALEKSVYAVIGSNDAIQKNKSLFNDVIKVK